MRAEIDKPAGGRPGAAASPEPVPHDYIKVLDLVEEFSQKRARLATMETGIK